MEVTAEQLELIGGFPMERVKKRSLLMELSDAYEKHGSLIPQNMIPRLLGVSRERVRALIAEGRLAAVRVDDRNFIPWDSFRYYCAEEKKHGRPMKTRCAPSLLRVADRVSDMLKK
jgi:hypothetical protein